MKRMKLGNTVEREITTFSWDQKKVVDGGKQAISQEDQRNYAFFKES